MTNHEAKLMYLIGVVETTTAVMRGPISDSQRAILKLQLDNALDLIASSCERWA